MYFIIFSNFLGHTFSLIPTVKVRDFKACIYLDTHFLLNCDVIYHINSYYIFVYLFFQESIGLLGPVEIHVRQTENVNGIVPTYIRI